jgi:hypothetical protein
MLRMRTYSWSSSIACCSTFGQSGSAGAATVELAISRGKTRQSLVNVIDSSAVMLLPCYWMFASIGQGESVAAALLVLVYYRASHFVDKRELMVLPLVVADRERLGGVVGICGGS